MILFNVSILVDATIIDKTDLLVIFRINSIMEQINSNHQSN